MALGNGPPAMPRIGRSLPPASSTGGGGSAQASAQVRSLYNGLWHALHGMAARASTPARQAAFVELLNMYIEEFPCEACRGHLNEFVRKHPLAMYVKYEDEYNRQIGFAKWTWILHNDVNTRLGKPYYDWDTFSRRWLPPPGTEIEPCNKDCGK